MMNRYESAKEKFVRPNLIDTAELAHDLTSQDWSYLGSPKHDKKTEEASLSDDPFGSKRVDELTEDILSLLLIRMLAILYKRSDAPGLPRFRDLSTTTICRTIMADEMRRLADETLAKELNPLDWPDMMTDDVIFQLRTYIAKILSMYRGVYYHNCEHAHHVFLSANKLLDLVLCEHEWVSLQPQIQTGNGTSTEEEEDADEFLENFQKLAMMDPEPKDKGPTYGIKSNPVIQFAFLFSALVHDVDHKGVSNRQLVLESDELAIMYNDQSVAEQRSLAVAFSLLMQLDFDDLREALFMNNRQEFTRFRKIVIDLVLCTDISSPERVQIGKSKFKEAFADKKKRSGRRESNDNNQTDAEDPKEKEKLARRKKERNAWKSKPADPNLAEPIGKNTLVRQFFNARGSIAASLPTEKHDEMFDSAMFESAEFSYDSTSGDDNLSDSSSDYSSCYESETQMSYKIKETEKLARPGSADHNKQRKRRSNESKAKRVSNPRRFTEPHSMLRSSPKKFHFRLGIRRALDLTGSTIEAYDQSNETTNQSEPDPDCPNELKAIVVLEHMLRVSDVAANLQVSKSIHYIYLKPILGILLISYHFD